jgi:dienelactone hydrolase
MFDLCEECTMAAADFRDKLLEGLGGPWPEPCPLEPRTIESTPGAEYRIDRIEYQVEPGERVAALVLVPHAASADRPAPGMCVWHQHNGEYHLGKSEPAGLAGNPMHHTGAALARLGYVVVCPDALGFEERVPGKLREGALERFLFLRYVVSGKCLAWKNILDMRRTVDLLAGLPEVRADRLGCYGHSMGSTHAWLVAPWEPRLKAVVGNCCLPTYAGIHRHELLHCFPNFVPGIFPHGDTPDIAALVAPRALHLNFGELDEGSPIEEVRRGVETITAAYQAQHAEDRFTWFIEEGTGHVLSESMWARARDFLARHLQS